MAQNLRAFFILYVIKIIWIIFIKEKIEFSNMSQRPRWSSTKFQDYLSLSAKIKQQQNIAKNFTGVAESWYPVVQGWHLPPHAPPHGCRPALSSPTLIFGVSSDPSNTCFTPLFRRKGCGIWVNNGHTLLGTKERKGQRDYCFCLS